MPELMIFDCDGVLVDSEVIAMQVEQEKLAQIGVDMTLEELADRFVGISYRSMADILQNKMGIELPPDFIKSSQAEAIRRFEKELKPIDGIKDTLQALNLPRCVASSSDPDRIETSLSLTGVRPFFDDNLFSAKMVENGKPAPDLFLFAADKMKAKPSDCLVIEDSAAGIEAARSAGMTVWGFQGAGHAKGEGYRIRIKNAGANHYFDDMRALPAMVGSM